MPLQIQKLGQSLIVAMLLTIGLAACGKENSPVAPEGEAETYPRTYPTR
ncbi:MAG: hypothetical protein OSB67_05405 [Alphaproteobacteria bacterium]|nr:hypothetical protein [Alphaproteobacteria bacterium]